MNDCLKRSSSKENVTTVTTINAAGRKVSHWFIYKSWRVQAMWIKQPHHSGSWYAGTDSSFMQGPTFLSIFVKKFEEFVIGSDLDGDNPHIFFLDGRALHGAIDVSKDARADNNTHLSQLLLHP